MMVRRILAAFLAFLCLAATPFPGALEEEQERKEGPMVVYGDDFMFILKEPEGWQGDIENAPKLKAGVVLYRKKETFEKHTTLIVIRIAHKVDENTKEDLAHEMKAFRTLYPDVTFEALAVKHPLYTAHARAFVIPKSRYDYLTFLNPGSNMSYLLSVAMNTGKKKATKDELQVYREVVRSLEFVPQDAAKEREWKERFDQEKKTHGEKRDLP